MRPPRIAELIVGLLIPSDYREEHLGDLEEGFSRRLATSKRDATRWYWRQAMKSVVPGLAMRMRSRTESSSTSGGVMETLRQDVRYGLLALKKSPMFALVATATLALAIGVNTAIFSLVSTVVFAELPMGDSESVSIIRGQNLALEIDQGSLSVPDYLDLSERATSFESTAALSQTQWVWNSGDAPIRLQGLQFTANLLDTWRLPPVLGRDFAPGEDAVGAAPVALISFPFWQAQFAGDPAVLGRSIRLDGVEHTIVGVTDPKLGFASFATAQVITPLILPTDGSDRDRRILFVSGRLAEGVNQARATEEARAIGRALADEFPGTNRGWGMWSAPVLESLIDDGGRTIMLMLILTVTFVVLIACANIANMLLARATARAGEMSIRSALGAGRGRLVRQLITESVVISLLAGVIGVGLASGLLKALVRISQGTEEILLMAEIDGRVLGFTLLISLLAPLFFGLLPALQASKTNAASALKDGRSAGGSRKTRRTRSALVAAQVALALTLMIVSGLLVRTVQNLTQREVGFETAGMATVGLTLPEQAYETEEARLQFFTRVQEELGEVSSVRQTALVSAIPRAHFGSLRAVEIEGRALSDDEARPSELIVTASGSYFELTGIPVLQGRNFSAVDDEQSPPVVVLSQEVATQHWRGENPVGRRIRIGGTEEDPWLTVIGVVGDVVATTDTERPARNVYLPYSQNAARSAFVVVRTDRSVEAVAGEFRSAVWSVDANQPVDEISTVELLQSRFSASEYALLTLFVLFAVFALVMAGLGIYGVMAYSVAQRRMEIGLRMALGAEAGSVRRMILGQGVRVLAAGAAAGLLASLLLGRLLSNLVFGIQPTDPLTYGVVAAILGLVALVANLVPAVRATRVDPLAALRSD
ncbi:MAG: ADOP family duplicated permease [Longimicrobiales bacterium]